MNYQRRDSTLRYPAFAEIAFPTAISRLCRRSFRVPSFLITKNRRRVPPVLCYQRRDSTLRYPAFAEIAFPTAISRLCRRSFRVPFLNKKTEDTRPSVFLPETGLGPVRAQCPGDFKSPVSTIPPLWRKGDDMTKITLRLQVHPL